MLGVFTVASLFDDELFKRLRLLGESCVVSLYSCDTKKTLNYSRGGPGVLNPGSVAPGPCC